MRNSGGQTAKSPILAELECMDSENIEYVLKGEVSDEKASMPFREKTSQRPATEPFNIQL